MATTKKTVAKKATNKKSTAKKAVKAKTTKKEAKNVASIPMSISGKPEEINKIKSKAEKANMSVSRYIFSVVLGK